MGVPEELALLINGKGVKITRGDLWGALQRIPPAGVFATRMGAAPYAQALLLSILASRECESCKRADNGGGHPCDCPVPCGARYCQHPSGEPQPADTPADPELAAMAAIVAAMDELGDHAILLGEDVHERVIRWAMARWNVCALLTARPGASPAGAGTTERRTMSKAEPTGSAEREDRYCEQNGTFRLTPAQRRRSGKKFARWAGRSYRLAEHPARAAQRGAKGRPTPRQRKRAPRG